MNSLQGFIDEVITLLRTVDGMDFVPDEPTLMPSTLPISLVYASSGVGKMSPIGWMTYLHNVRIAFVGPLQELGITNDFILGKAEDLIEVVYAQLVGDGFTNAMGVGDFSYSIGPDDWGGLAVYGLFLEFEEVKIQRSLQET